MADFSKINYYDLRLEASKHRLAAIIGRTEEMSRLSRILSRQTRHNAIITGPSGSGKTALLRGWAGKAAVNPAFGGLHIVQLDTASLGYINAKSGIIPSFYQEAFHRLKNCVVIIDNFGELVYGQPAALQSWLMLMRPILEDSTSRIVLSLEPQELSWINDTHKAFLNFFEALELKPQPEEEQMEILEAYAGRILPAPNESRTTPIQPGALKAVIQLLQRFPVLGQLPGGALQLLDEGLAEIRQTGQKSELTPETIARIASEKTGIPLNKLNQNELKELKSLETTLNSRVVGQNKPLSSIVSIIQRAKLGLRSQNRPLGSFLLLGPSGVGKTETAKALAEELYGRSESFLRIDMSEFSEPHTVHRLIGSPPGYVGFDAGGQLTNHFKREPYSLLLLDEIEKSHPKIFDIFLQMLDDGRVTSGQGETINITQATVIATSNLAVDEILEGFERGEDIHSQNFLKQHIMPVLRRQFRMEFLNRFDGILIYKPLLPDDLVNIALLEIKKIEERVKEHNIRFSISPETLRRHIQNLADPRLGARPVKRFVEEICETLITKKLLG